VVFLHGPDLIIRTAHNREAVLNQLEGLFLVSLQRQDIVPAALHDLPGQVSLAAHRINRDDLAAQAELPQQVREGRDLVVLGVDHPLGHDQPVGTGPGRDHVEWWLAGGTVPGAADRLAVEGDHRGEGLRRGGSDDALDQTEESVLVLQL